MARFKKTACILISGKAGIGKTTLADIMVNQLASYNVKKFSFASTIKIIARDIFRWNMEKDDAGRALLQGLGKVGREYNQDIWVTYTLNQIESHIDYPFDVVVIDDWRYENEAELFKNNPLYQVVRIRVLGESFKPLDSTLAADVSEVSLYEPELVPEVLFADCRDLPDREYDFIVNNTGDKDQLSIASSKILELI